MNYKRNIEVDEVEQDKVFSRNLGLISKEEQQKLRKTTILIAGVGGDGGLLSERLVRFGIGRIILADPDYFDISNLNRQYAANINTVGKNKAEAVGAELRLINPKIEVNIITEGITEDNVIGLVELADVIIDEIEFSLPQISVMLHSAARKQGKHIFMGANIGWGSSLFCFSPDGFTFEEFFNFESANNTIDTLAYFPAKPSYISDEVLEEILAGNIPVPGVASSVALVAAVLSNDIILFITGKRKPILAPQFRFIDLFDYTTSICNKTAKS